MPGPLTVTSWDAGSVSLAGASLHVVVHRPDSGGPYPVVGVVHGASRNGTFQRVLAQTLASYGLVAVVPDIPCQVFSCDHNANANQILAMLDWAVMQSADGTSPIAGTIDGARRGLVGHSWGALGSHLAASRSTMISSLVLLDPNDDGGVGAAAASMVTAPTLQLLAQNRGTCNNQWISSNVTPMLAGPALATTIARSGHCDPEDPTDSICPFACGNGDASTTPTFRRYAVAWTVCNLVGDGAVAPWVGGSAFDAEVTSGTLTGPVQSRLGELRCRGAMVVDAGVVSGDASVDSGTLNDSSTMSDGATVMDAIFDAASVDAGARDSSAIDVAATGDSAADAGRGTSGGSCRCKIARAGQRERGWTLIALAAAVSTRRRRRDSTAQRPRRTQ
jgi:dienelactone hydrolase